MMFLAGDIFDGPYTREGYEAVYRALERVRIPVFISPGNHDPYRDGSPWTRERWPGNVYLFKYSELTSYRIRELDCRVYGAAFTSDECPGLLEDFRAECDERYALLCLHGDPTAITSPYCPVTAVQIREAGLDYAALGHIHAPGRFDAGAGMCAWPGTPMGKGFDEIGLRGVLVTTIDDVAQMRFLPLEVPRFFEHTVAAGDDPAAAVQSLLPPAGTSDFIRIHLTGEVRPGATDRLDRQFADYPNLTIFDETIPTPDLWEHAGEDSLTGMFFRILQDAALESDPATAERLELAARIGRRILDGREVELP